MNTKEYVASLFKDYEESDGLKDFMEEIQSNLDARIASFVHRGMPENEAFEKACAELGDVSLLADEFSLKKRREVFEDAYLETRKYMKGGRVAAYVIFSFLAVFGFIVALIALFSVGWATGWAESLEDTGSWSHHGGFFEFDDFYFDGTGLDWLAFAGAFMPFLVTAIGGFTYLGLTQETKSRLPMSGKRAAWYTAASVLISFGLILSFITYLAVRFSGAPFELVASAVVLIPFVLPGTGILLFLVMTEKNRMKKWASTARSDEVKEKAQNWTDPNEAERFKIYNKAIWMFAVAAFFLLGFTTGFGHSWLVFIFAAAIVQIVRGFMMKKKG